MVVFEPVTVPECTFFISMIRHYPNWLSVAVEDAGVVPDVVKRVARRLTVGDRSI